MTDYNKETVAQLRQILKDRGIPSTGLTRKAQIVERLETADAEELESKQEEVENEQDEDAATNEDHVSEESASAVEEDDTEPASPSVAPTSDRLPENVSHIDIDMPLPSQIDTIEHTAEDTTTAEEPGTLQPVGVFNAAPADPEHVVGPTITEPADEEVGDESDNLAEDELPEAPGPAAEALRFAHEKQPLINDSLTTTTQSEVPAADEESIAGNLTADTSRLATEELEADTKKRKRRSGSPDLPAEELRAKKPRPSQEPIHLPEDIDVVMEERRPEDELSVVAEAEDKETSNHPVNTKSSAQEPSIRRENKENASRYKDLVQPTVTPPQEALSDDRPMVPALHPATPALYIRNFMRPLRPEPLRAHLVSLTSLPSSSPNPEIIQSLFLDAMKTHALVHFTSTTAATRVRASLHGSIWPHEGNRRELWVDFVPEDKVESWIKQEEDAILAEKEARASGHPIPAKRFEVIYPTDPDNDNNITAVFQQVGSAAPPNAPRGPRPVTLPPKQVREENQSSFATLGSLFQTTVAKPQLYFLPISDEVADQRQQTLRDETSRDWTPEERRKGRGIREEVKYRYWFDEGGRVVEGGEDFGPWGAEEQSGRGRGGGGGGWGGRGRGRGRGWRGGF